MAADNENAGPLQNLTRGAEFWQRASSIYLSYKTTQLHEKFLKLQGKSDEFIKSSLWDKQQERAGQAMYNLCVSLRGFYLKAGQFIGARGDFVPEQICRTLSLLHDKVPPMPPAQAKEIVLKELQINDLNEVFEWIDLEKPLGSASISQVHKARLRHVSNSEVRAHDPLRRTIKSLPRFTHIWVKPGTAAWDICNMHGISLSELQKSNPGADLERLEVGQRLRVPVVSGLTVRPEKGGEDWLPRAVVSLHHAQQEGLLPRDRLVAVKVQYPDADKVMVQDLKNLRAAAAFLSKTELKFDLVSAVEELHRQIRLEFDFCREARIMDTIGEHLRPLRSRITVPRSLPGLVTRRLLVMEYINGTPLNDAAEKLASLPKWKATQAKRLVLTRVSEAYGTMMLREGLFQADGHPGNILLCPGGRVALLDYGQAKQLPPHLKTAFAQLLVDINRRDDARISASLAALGVETETTDASLRSKMGVGMFDTSGKVDPFDRNSPIKQSAISKFPPDMFFVLRVVQLLRGMSNAMGISDFSSAQQWGPLARQALREASRAAKNSSNGQASLMAAATPLVAT